MDQSYQVNLSIETCFDVRTDQLVLSTLNELITLWVYPR